MQEEHLNEPSSIDKIFSLEITSKIKLNNELLLRSQIDEDINELNICFDNKAYKATLIMAGSIMEAILIDWLSEIKGEDYFKVELKKRKYNKKLLCYERDSKGEYFYTEKRTDLADYIDEIRNLKKPTWMEEAQDAHEI